MLSSSQSFPFKSTKSTDFRYVRDADVDGRTVGRDLAGVMDVVGGSNLADGMDLSGGLNLVGGPNLAGGIDLSGGLNLVGGPNLAGGMEVEFGRWAKFGWWDGLVW